MKRILTIVLLCAAALMVSACAEGPVVKDGKAVLYVKLPDCCPTPDGMALCPKSGKIYLNIPNYATAATYGDQPQKGNNLVAKKNHPAILATIDKQGKFIVYQNSGRYSNSEWIAMLVAQSKETRSVQTASRSRRNCFT